MMMLTADSFKYYCYDDDYAMSQHSVSVRIARYRAQEFPFAQSQADCVFIVERAQE